VIPAAATPPRRLVVALAAGLAALVALAFWRVPLLPFVPVDDLDYFVSNPHVARGLTLDTLRWAVTTFDVANWHPVTWLSLALDRTLFGPGPAGPHAVNLALHAVNAVLLLVLLVRTTGAPWRSALVAALFALHPLRVESVAWVSERKDLLAGLFWLATTLQYVAWTRRGGAGRYAGVLALFALGLASKPMLVTLPFALLLLDAWPLGRLDPARPWVGLWPRVREKLPLLALAAASSAVTYLAQAAVGATRPLEDVGLGDRLVNAAFAYLGYAAKTAWPSGLAFFYPYPAERPGLLAAAAAFGALAAVTAAALALRVRRPAFAVGWLWFLGTLVPVIGLVQVGAQAMADRYTYLPCLGLVVALVYSAPTPASAGGRRAVAALAGAAVLALVPLTLRQVGFWRDSTTLFAHTAAVTERNWVAETFFGIEVEQRGDLEAAVGHYRRAVKWNPRAAEALGNLGNALVSLGRDEEGIAWLREAVRQWPDYATALNNLGAALAGAGRPGEALPFLVRAVAVNPDDANARFNLALVLLDAGRTVEALPHLEAAARLAPENPRIAAEVARVRSRSGR